MKCRKDRLGCIGRKGQALSHRNVSHQERQGYGATEPPQEHRAEAEGARPRQLAAGCWVLGAGCWVSSAQGDMAVLTVLTLLTLSGQEACC